MSTECNNKCKSKIDINEFYSVYGNLNDTIRKYLDEDYDCKKINGATYADTWAKIMGPAIGQVLNALVSLETKETPMDRCVKQEQCDASQAKTKREDNLISGEIANDKCRANAECALKLQQENNMRIKNGKKQVDKNGKEISWINPATGILDEYSTPVQERLLIERKRRAEELKNGDSSVGDMKKASLYERNKKVLAAQEALYIRQKFGFNDNARQKVFETQANAWAVGFQNTEGGSIPGAFQESSQNAGLALVRNNIGK